MGQWLKYDTLSFSNWLFLYHDILGSRRRDGNSDVTTFFEGIHRRMLCSRVQRITLIVSLLLPHNTFKIHILRLILRLEIISWIVRFVLWQFAFVNGRLANWILTLHSIGSYHLGFGSNWIECEQYGNWRKRRRTWWWTKDSLRREWMILGWLRWRWRNRQRHSAMIWTNRKQNT